MVDLLILQKAPFGGSSSRVFFLLSLLLDSVPRHWASSFLEGPYPLHYPSLSHSPYLLRRLLLPSPYCYCPRSAQVGLTPENSIKVSLSSFYATSFSQTECGFGVSSFSPPS